MKVAILRRNGLGDLLAAFPMMAHLQELYPSLELTLFVEERNAMLCPYLNFNFNFVVLKSHGNKYFQLIRALQFRNMKFDMAISAKTSPMKLANLFLYFLGAKKRVAYVKESWDRSLINEKRKNETRPLHQALKGLKLLDPSIKEIPNHYYPKLKRNEGLIEKYRIIKKEPLLLISASTTQENNRLDPEKYAAALNSLAQVKEFSTVIIAEKRDEMRAFEIQNKLVRDAEVIIPSSFDHFMAILSQGDLAFFSDGGASHIAAALGLPLLVLFGGVDPKVWAPLSEKCRVLYHPVEVNQIEGNVLAEGLFEIWQLLKNKNSNKNISQ